MPRKLLIKDRLQLRKVPQKEEISQKEEVSQEKRGETCC